MKKDITTREVLEAEAELEEEKILEEETEDSAVSEEETDSDDEFMQSIAEEPLTEDKARKQRESLLASIANCQKTVDSLHDLAEANKTGALNILRDKVKDTLSSSLEDEDIKELKDGVKQLEAVKVTLGLIGTLCGQYATAQADIKRYQEQLSDLKEKCIQLSLPFEDTQTDSDEEEKEREKAGV